MVQSAVAALSLLPDRGAGLLRDLGELAARERRQALGRVGSPRPLPTRVVAQAGSAGIARCNITA